jgi:hypothetical protein
VARLIRGDPSISTVYLGCNDIQHQGVKELVDAIEQSDSVRALWLKRNPVGITGAGHLAAMLRVNQSLRTLDLVNSGIGNAGLALLVDALNERAKPLMRLHVGGNGTDVEGGVLLARLLAGPGCPAVLTVAVSRLGDAGATALAAGLPAARALRQLGLPSGGIGPAGMMALLVGAREGGVLEWLDLSVAASTRALGGVRNRVGDTGAAMVAAALADDTVLRGLDLSGNQISDATGLLAALATNTTLVHLRVGGRVPRPQRLRLRSLLARNVRSYVRNAAEFEDVIAIQSVYRVPPTGTVVVLPDVAGDGLTGVARPAGVLTAQRAETMSAADFGQWLAARGEFDRFPFPQLADAGEAAGPAPAEVDDADRTTESDCGSATDSSLE